jgi:hypothetical protein
MPVDGAVPFNMEVWVAHAGVTYYQGTFVRDNQTVTASFSPVSARLIQAGQ